VGNRGELFKYGDKVMCPLHSFFWWYWGLNSGLCTTTWAMLPALSALVIFFFWIGCLQFCLGHLGQRSLYLYLLSSWACTTTPNLLIEMGGLTKLLPRLALNCNPPDLCFQSSWDYRLEPWHLAMMSPFLYVLLHASHQAQWLPFVKLRKLRK
jgi:hypothetical protein